MRKLSVASVLVLCLFALTASAAPQVYEIKAGASRRVITVKDGSIVKSEAVFEEGGELQPLNQEFFFLLGSPTPTYQGDRLVMVPVLLSSAGKVLSVDQTDPGSASFRMGFSDPDVEVILKYQAHAAGFISKTLLVRPVNGSVFIGDITLENFSGPKQAEEFNGPGQPVYVGGSFFAAAYPSASNRVIKSYDSPQQFPDNPSERTVTCLYLVGQTVTDSYTSYSSIYGVAPKGTDVRRFFQDAVESMRARPVKPFLLWNSWYHVFDFTDVQIIDAINAFKQKLIDPYGIKIDSFVLDDGWDDYRHVWQPHPKRFPNGFGTVAKAAEAAGGHPGLWMSPMGGYGWGHQKRTFFALGSGYETNRFGFCISGKNYGRAFGDYLTGYQRDYGVNYFKFDNIDSNCKSTRHGHRAGEYSQVALTDAFIGVMKRAREVNPDVAINITVGSWMSPFWTIWCDFVWRTGWDWKLAGVGSERQQSITYVDTILYEKLRVEDLQFPVNSLMTHGVIKGLRQNFNEANPPRDFFDDIWMYFGRGVMMQELYLSPELLTDAEWKELARAITWSHQNYRLVSKAEMILGDPRKLEVYGFRSKLGKETALVLRNPSLIEKPAPAEEIGACGAWQMVYASTGAAATDSLGAFETRVLYCAGE